MSIEIPQEIRVQWRPPEDLTVSEWAEKYRVLAPETSAEPGDWRNIRTPYLRGIMDAFSNPFIERIVFSKGSQLGGTEALYNMLGYAIHQDPAPCLFVMPTLDLAKYVSRKRIQPMIDASPELKRRKPQNEDDYNTLEMLFPGMVLTLAGANSPASLASRPCRYVFLDEVDKFPKFAGREADPISLAMERQKTFWNRKTVIISTPTVEEGQITKAMAAVDVVFDFWVPCPHCGKVQTLKFKQVKWPEFDKKDPLYASKVRDSAWYECEACSQHITDLHRPTMVQAGEWRPRVEIKRQPRSVGFHLPSFYSLWLTWGDMAEIFVKSEPYQEKLMNVINSWFAEPWVKYSQTRKEDNILKLRDTRPRGLVPAEGVLGITAGIDTQDNGFYYVIRAWGQFEESWLIRDGFTDSWEAIFDLMSGRYLDVNGNEYIISLAFQDSQGHRTAEVYERLRASQNVKPTKGEQRMATPYAVSTIDTYPGTNKAIPGGLRLYRINTKYYKDKLSAKLDIAPADPGAFLLHSETSEDYARQMVAEYLDEKDVWVCPSGRPNHSWDCEVLSLAAADILGIRHWKKPVSAPKSVQDMPQNRPQQPRNQSRVRLW